MNRDSILSCELCLEVQRGDHSPSRPATVEDSSRLVFRVAGVDVMAGLGSLEPGYVLVLPHRHVPSSGDLSTPERSLLHATARATAYLIERVFQHRVLIVEHGSSGKAAGQAGGGCITHCHLHLFPVPWDTDPLVMVPPDAHPVAGLNLLAEAAARRQNYYYRSSLSDGGYLAVGSELVSQYARRIWAEILGMPDTWDWAAFPYIENCHLTIKELRRDEAHMRERLSAEILDETLAAYASNASRYAAATEEFAGNSTLPAQLDELLAATRGVVLDAGAGGGRDSDYVAAAGRLAIAMDASAALLTELTWARDFSRLVADIRSIPLADSSVGAIWCSAVLLHLDPTGAAQALRELRRVLDPDGLMQVSVKEGRGIRTEALIGTTAVRHFFLYELQELTAMAESAGFEVVKAWVEEEDSSGKTLQRWAKAVVRKSL
ncbi:methyltransferase domain-containing protein [Micromonospora sp. NPDC050686]|uniref:methyltransferase domain-containing protein n=1 Tax=Micromonospora sp. NPDC050686 TaxID=3154631 RepID=UPI0034104296